MMVPMAKQKQHDELQALADEYSALTSKRLSQDDENVTAKLDELRGRADDISTTLLESGVDSNLINQFRKLKRDKDKEFSQEGLVGNAAMNYEAATNYVNELASKKERQAGWSPARAKQWAQAQVSGFQGTLGENGTFNTFTGRELATKYDLQEFMESAVDNVAERVSPIAMNAIRVGGLPAFHQAFQSGKVSKKDYNTIMESMVLQAQNNPDLLASLQQESFWTGEENPTDFGRFEIVKGKDGKDTRTWRVGNSMAARRMAGMALGAQYNNVDIDYKILTDDLGLMMYKRGLEEQDALQLINFENGELTQLDALTLDDVENTLRLANQELKATEASMTALRNQLTNGVPADQVAEVLAGNRQYQQLRNQYENAKVSQNNANARMEVINRRVDNTVLDANDKKVHEVMNVIKEYGGPDAAAAALGIRMPPMSMSIGYEDNRYEREIALAKAMGVDLSKYKGVGGPNPWWNATSTVNNKRQRGFEQYVGADPQAEHFTMMNAQNTGKYSTFFGAMNDQLSQDFNPQAATLAYGKGRFADIDLESELGKIEDGKNYEYKVSLTDGWDNEGQKFNNVMITNPSTGKVMSVQVIDNLSDDFYLNGAQQLANGSYKQQQMSKQLMANMNYMPAIKQSNLAFANRGQIGGIPFRDSKGNALPVEWVKHQDATGTYYTASIGGVPINNGQSIKGEKEMALAIDAFVKSKMPQQ